MISVWCLLHYCEQQPAGHSSVYFVEENFSSPTTFHSYNVHISPGPEDSLPGNIDRDISGVFRPSLLPEVLRPGDNICRDQGPVQPLQSPRHQGRHQRCWPLPPVERLCRLHSTLRPGDISRLYSYWLSSYNTALSLDETFIVLKYF